MRRFGAGVRKRRFCAGVRKRRFCAGVRKRRFCVGVRKRALQRSCVKFFEMDRCARRAQGARCTHRYNSSCTHGYSSSCTHGLWHPERQRASFKMVPKIAMVPICTIRVVPIGRDALASHAVSVYTRFSQAPSFSILAVGAEALSMTPSGDALFAS